METLRSINFLIALILFACYAYQMVYLIIGLVKKPPRQPKATPRKYAVLICARNEEVVIGELIASIKAQKYPSHCLDIFVAADNCTDSTAQTAREAGATVYERFNRQRVGKGYALNFLFHQILQNHANAGYEGYLILDADNLLDENYMAEMNNTFAQGHRIITSYRNSKNYGDNWISAGYSLWFLREARYLNGPRMALGTSCAVSGTGFLVHRDIIEKNNGWKHFLLTEDIEFTIDNVLEGERIAYCPAATLYDEQPVTLAQSWRQRMRWAKGYIQVFQRYGTRLFKGMFAYGGYACYDMTMAILPAIVLTVASFLINGLTAALTLTRGPGQLPEILLSVGETLFNAYLALLGVGAVTAITEWRQIHCPWHKKIFYCFTFPLFMFTYIPISIAAFFRRVQWKPIEHRVKKTVGEVRVQR